jgi:hypothetical protein
MDAATETLLQEILRRESRSLLSYAAEAYPWTTARGGEVLDFLQRLIAEEKDAVAALGRFLVRRRIPLPYLGAYPTAFTTVNFISLDWLLPRLVEEERRSLGQLDADLDGIHDADARAAVEKLAAVKRRHLPALEAFAGPQPQPATT